MDNQIAFSSTDKLKASLFVATATGMVLFCIIKFVDNLLHSISPLVDLIRKDMIIIQDTALAPTRQCFVNDKRNECCNQHSFQS